MNCPTCAGETNAGGICPRCSTMPEAGLTGTVTPTAPTKGTSPSGVITVDFSAGAVFHDRYEILGPLGRGGMGIVYRARDRSLDEVVAIKILRPEFAEDERMADRFRSEIKLARKVRHRNVCAIHDYGVEQGLLFISMELIEGTDLKQFLRAKGALAPAEAFDLAIQIADGLQAVHEAGIIHRDLKTANVVRDQAGTARLMDFGIAKRHGIEGGTVTGTGNIVGTPEYMSPEQGQGRKVDFRSDVYALGILIYELFTGAVPFRGDTPISTILMHIQDPPPLDGPGAPKLPPPLIPVLRRSLAKHPEDRYPSAAAVAEDLRQARTGRTPVVPVKATAPSASGRRGMIAAIAVLVVVVLGAAGVWMTRGHATEPSPFALTPVSTIAAPPPPAVASASPAATIAESPSPLPTAPPVLIATHTPPPTIAARPSPHNALNAAPVPPAATPPPATAPPATAAAGPGEIQVVAKPWAEVSVDGRVLGETPLDRVTLSPGVHTVRFRHPAWEPIVRSVTVRSGETDRVAVDFTTQGTKKQ